MTGRIRTAVIGLGHFGRFHADKYARLARSQLVGVVDADPARAAEVGRKLKCEPFTDYRALFGKVDAVSVVVPTQMHHEVALACLNAGIHVLVEKPITETLEQADALIRAAAEHKRVLQVGHLQRFLLQRLGADTAIKNPLYIEAVRIAPYKPRGTDVGVTLDLMIHDIDMVLALVQAPVTAVDAVGAPVVSPTEDIANTRLRFANGCVANITASRVSLKTERKMRIFQRDAYVSIDLHNRKYTLLRKGSGKAWFPGLPPIDREERSFAEGDDLEAEIAAFLAAVASGTPPLVSGEDGRRALETAMKVTASLTESLERVSASGI
ncbi:MAG TPA: Gfo/Idh/MocA family oxidoreductase [Alphaproteobacteria bacterium]|nr:Gfo/Idh/MocA family oxidoreductase [Alphaproteobacteria bacterium]